MPTEVKRPSAKRPTPPEQACRKIVDIIESIDMRCGAADGPVTPTRQEMTDKELRQIYQHAKGAANVPDIGPQLPMLVAKKRNGSDMYEITIKSPTREDSQNSGATPVVSIYPVTADLVKFLVMAFGVDVCAFRVE